MTHNIKEANIHDPPPLSPKRMDIRVLADTFYFHIFLRQRTDGLCYNVSREHQEGLSPSI
jgi:hypothetical protein